MFKRTMRVRVITMKDDTYFDALDVCEKYMNDICMITYTKKNNNVIAFEIKKRNLKKFKTEMNNIKGTQIIKMK